MKEWASVYRLNGGTKKESFSGKINVLINWLLDLIDLKALNQSFRMFKKEGK